MKITVVDYGVGNLFSVKQALRKLDFEFKCDEDGSLIKESDLIIVPGVAAFGTGMTNLTLTLQKDHITDFHAKGKPIIGLCLGAQMFLDSSAEAKEVPGLSLIKGKVVDLNNEICRVPKQGWSRVSFDAGGIFGEFSGKYFYFSHSYKMVPDDDQVSIGKTSYGNESVVALYNDANLLGVQFHPERSGLDGLQFLEKAIRTASIWA
jgi:glutamine amidotransferase